MAAVLLYPTLTRELHPPIELLPLSDDSEVSITAPADGASVDAGAVEVVVAVTGGSIGPGDVPSGSRPADPEEAGALAVAVAPLGADGEPGTRVWLDVDL